LKQQQNKRKQLAEVKKQNKGQEELPSFDVGRNN